MRRPIAVDKSKRWRARKSFTLRRKLDAIPKPNERLGIASYFALKVQIFGKTRLLRRLLRKYFFRLCVHFSLACSS